MEITKELLRDYFYYECGLLFYRKRVGKRQVGSNYPTANRWYGGFARLNFDLDNMERF